MNRQDNDRLVLTVPEAANALGLSVRSTYSLCKRADFPTIRLTPNRIGVSRAGLEQWVVNQTALPGTPGIGTSASVGK